VRSSYFTFLVLAAPLAAGSPESVKCDQYGDPLPPGAVERFGKSWLNAGARRIVPSPDGKSILCLRYGIYLDRFDRETGKLTRTTTLPAEPTWETLLAADGRRAVLFHGTYGQPTDVWEVWDLDRRKLVSTIRPQCGQGAFLNAISPDGRHVVSASDSDSVEGNVKFSLTIWDADSGRQTGNADFELPVDGHGSGWNSAPRFSADGRYLLRYSGHSGQTFLTALNLKGRVLWQRVIPNKDSWSPVEINGRLLLGVSPCRVVDWESGEEITLRLPPDMDPSGALGTSCGGKTLLYSAAVGNESELRAWNFEKAAADPDIRPLRLRKEAFAYQWQPGGTEVVVTEGVPRIIDLRTGRQIGPHRTSVGHSSAIMAIAFSVDGTRMVSVDEYDRLRLWDMSTGRWIEEWMATPSPVQWEFNGWGGGNGTPGVPAFDLSVDGRRLVLAEQRKGDNSPQLRVVDTATGSTIATRALPQKKAGNVSTVGRLGFSPSADRVFVAFGDWQDEQLADPTHKLSQWDLPLNQWRDVGTMPMSSAARGGRIGSRWFVGGRVFDAESGKQVSELTGASRWGFAVTPDCRLAAGLGRGDGPAEFGPFDPIRDLRVWDARTGDPICELSCPPVPIVPLTRSISGEMVDDPRTSGRKQAVWPHCLALHPSGRWLATSDIRGVRLWDLLTGRVVHTFPMPYRPAIETHLGSPATSLAFTPDGDRLATGTPDGTILIWAVPRRKADPVAPGELESLWNDLTGPDGTKGWRAAWRLMDDPRAAIGLIRAKLKPAERVSDMEVARLLAAVNSPDFRRREAATRRLEAIIDRVSPAVTEAAKAATASPELRERLHKVLATAPGDDRPLPVRAAAQSRAVAVQEFAGTPDGRAALRDLAAGPPEAWLTREAEAALARLATRKP
jgi:WD40 repeat protein